jgi:hypothetical protein
MYGLGFLFVPKENFKNTLLERLYPDHQFAELEDLSMMLNHDVKHRVKDMRAMFNFLTTISRDVAKKIDDNFLPTSILLSLKKIFLPDVKKANAKQKDLDFLKDLIRNDEFLNQIHDTLLNKALAGKFGKNDLQEIFLLDGKKIEETKTGGTTFVIQEVPLEKLKKTAKEGIDIYQTYFDYLLPASLKTGWTIQTLTGSGDNQNGLSNFLNSTLKEFSKGVSETRVLLKFGNPIIFSEEKNHELLDFLAKTAHELAKKVIPANENDFLKQSWHEYRSLLGGRLAGWLSNFHNRLTDYESALADNIHELELEKWGLDTLELKEFFLEKISDDCYVFQKDKDPSNLSKNLDVPQRVRDFLLPEFDQKTGELKKYSLKKEYRTENFIHRYKNIQKSHVALFKRIESECDFKNIFPENIKDSFLRLRELQPVLLNKLREATLGMENNSNDKKSVGDYLSEYISFLQILREFLISWANKGVDKIVIADGIEREIIVLKRKDSQLKDFWISEKLLKKNKIKEEEEKELDDSKLGFLSSEVIPSELKKYPAFLGQAKKLNKKEIGYACKHGFEGSDERTKIFNAKNLLLDFAYYGSQFCELIGNNKDKDWEDRNWLSTKKDKNGNWEDVYHLGAFHKSLESLRKISSVSSDNTRINEFLNSFCSDELKKEFEKEGFPEDKPFRFFVSGREYRKNYWKTISVQNISLNDFLKKFQDHFGLSLNMNRNDYEKFFGLLSNGIAKDLSTKGELIKFWWALRLKNINETVELANLDEKISNFIKVWVSLESIIFDPEIKIQRKIINRKMIQRFIQSGFGGEIRGKIALLGRKSFIERNVLQVTNGEQSALRYVPHEWGDFNRFDSDSKRKIQKRMKKRGVVNNGFKPEVVAILKEFNIDYLERSNQEIVEDIFRQTKTASNKNKLSFVLAEIPHSWELVLLTKIPLKRVEGKSLKEGFFIQKSETKSVLNLSTALNKNSFAYSFPIITSRHQKQFLEKFLYSDYGRDNKLMESIKGASLILEKNIVVQWDEGVPKFKPNAKDSFAMYAAIPFNFENTNRSKYQKGMIVRRDVTENGEKILGVDLGEYGFGWAVFDPMSGKFLAEGFQHVPLLGKMREQAKSWRDTQSRGIFSRPTTYLSEIREQAAGQVRNQIHRLSLEYGATPIYEDSVDAFESGGKRIEKLYKTLKTADVISGNSNDADEKVRKHIWGLEFARIGGVIGAAKTSQTCRNCGRCATSEISAMEGEKLKINDGKIFGSDISCDLEDGEYQKRDIELNVKNSQRFESYEEKSRRLVGDKKRGTNERFKCQICGNETDADEQAAQNIALKYFFAKFVATDADRKNEAYLNDKGQFSTLKFFLEKSRIHINEKTN